MNNDVEIHEGILKIIKSFLYRLTNWLIFPQIYTLNHPFASKLWATKVLLHTLYIKLTLHRRAIYLPSLNFQDNSGTNSHKICVNYTCIHFCLLKVYFSQKSLSYQNDKLRLVQV